MIISTLKSHKSERLVSCISLLFLFACLQPASFAATDDESVEPNPYSIEYIGSFGGSATELVYSGHFAFAGQRDMVRSFDMSDPEKPAACSSLGVRGIVESLTVVDTALYVYSRGFGDSFGALSFIDISNPSKMLFVDSFELGTGSVLKFTSGHLKILDYRGLISSYDLANPLKPTREERSVGDVEQNSTSGDGELSEKLSENVGQSAPLYSGISSASDIFIEGKVAIILDRYTGLNVFDLSLPESPKLISVFKPDFFPDIMSVSKDKAFLCKVEDDHSEVQILNLAKPERIESICTTRFGGRVREAGGNNGNFYFVTRENMNRLQKVDYSDRLSPVLREGLDVGSSILGFEIVESIGYLRVGSDIITIQCGSEGTPEILSTTKTVDKVTSETTFLRDLKVVGGTVYALGYTNGDRYFVVVNVTNPKNPRLTSTISIDNFQAERTAASEGFYCFSRVSRSNFGDFSPLDYIDCSDANNPKYFAAPHVYLDSPGGIATYHNFIYVLDNGLAIFKLK